MDILITEMGFLALIWFFVKALLAFVIACLLLVGVPSLFIYLISTKEGTTFLLWAATTLLFLVAFVLLCLKVNLLVVVAVGLLALFLGERAEKRDSRNG